MKAADLRPEAAAFSATGAGATASEELGNENSMGAGLGAPRGFLPFLALRGAGAGASGAAAGTATGAGAVGGTGDRRVGGAGALLGAGVEGVEGVVGVGGVEGVEGVVGVVRGAGGGGGI